MSHSTAFSTASRTSDSVVEMANDHWARQVFTDMSATSLELSEDEYVSGHLESAIDTDIDRAQCHGDVMPDAVAWLSKDNMQLLLKM